MSLLSIGEIFGHNTAEPVDKNRRTTKFCPFRNNNCTKQGKKAPLGICSMTDGQNATLTCPSRFLEGGRLFKDAARLAFGTGKSFIAVPEVRVLEVHNGSRKKKIGKVDFIIARIEDQTAVDFAALEIQGVYISGATIRPAFERYIETGEAPNAQRRPDFRSSAQKRLMPQLALKVPIFRRWGKRFFVAVDTTFFASLPSIPTQSASNAEVTWLAYPVQLEDRQYRMGNPDIHYTLWDDVVTSLREGTAPEKHEFLEQLTLEIGRHRMMET